MTNEQIIAHEKEQIIEKLQGHYLFGERLDFDNTDMIIVAAYFLGAKERMMLRYTDFEICPDDKRPIVEIGGR